MVVGRKDAAALPERPELPIAGVLAGKEGYHGHPETVTSGVICGACYVGRGMEDATIEVGPAGVSSYSHLIVIL